MLWPRGLPEAVKCYVKMVKVSPWEDLPCPPAQYLACCACRDKVQPTWLGGSSSSLLSEDPSGFFSGGAGVTVLLLAVFEVMFFCRERT